MVFGEGLREKLIDSRRGGDSGLTFTLLFARLTMLWLLLSPLPFRAAGGLNARAGGLRAREASGLTVRIVLLKGFG